MSAAQDEANKLFADKEYRTNHPEDDSLSDNCRSNDSDRENDSPAPSPSAAEIRDGPANIPYKKAHSNTGPKGVIRDAQSHRSAQLKAGSVITLAHANQLDSAASNVAPQMVQQPSRRDESSEGEAEEDITDDGFMEQWRRVRLRQLQQNGTHETEPVTPVDGDGYLEAVDGSGASTVVVVYIYDESSQVSRAVESCLSKVARRASSSQRNIKFVKLRYQEAEMEPAGVPALLAYRNGEKFAGLVPLVDEIPDDADLSESTLEQMLQRHQIL